MKQILLVDDDPFVCDLVSRILKNDYKLLTAEHGGRALDQLSNHHFNLVLLDIIMPEMDGWEVLRRIRANPRTALLPVMFLTGRREAEDRVQGFKMGVDDYLEKPFSSEELRLRIARLLERSEQMARPDSDDAAGFQGSLTDFGLAPVLTLLAMENKTGHLYLENNRTRILIYFRNGDVIKARESSLDEEDGYSAITKALSMRTGSFQFQQTPVTEEDEFNQSTSQLLLEVARAMDEKNVDATWQEPPEFKK